MSTAAKRLRARGEQWYEPNRRDLVRKAFEEGVRLLGKADFRKDIVEGAAPNWKGMAALTQNEKEHVYRDVRTFAMADMVPSEVLAMRDEVIRKTTKRSFRDRVRSFFGRA